MKYSHRNGETEPPTVSGSYYFNGEQVYRHNHLVWSGGEYVEKEREPKVTRTPTKAYMPWVDIEEGEVYWAGSQVPLTSYEGRWWGPVILTPPWEQEVSSGA